MEEGEDNPKSTKSLMKNANKIVDEFLRHMVSGALSSNEEMMRSVRIFKDKTVAYLESKQLTIENELPLSK